MIEQAMIFALGFLLAGLLALMLLPTLWRRAVRLTQHRIEVQLPVSMQEILGARDQLRAQNAVELRRLEDRATALNKIHATDMIELGRRAARIVRLADELTALQRAHREQVTTNRYLQRELAETSAQVAAAQKALFDADVVYSNKNEEIRQLSDELKSRIVLAEVRHASLGVAENYGSDLEKQLAALRNELTIARNSLRDKTDAVETLGIQLSQLRDERAKARKRLEAEAARVTDLVETTNAMRSEQTVEAAKLRHLNLKIDTGDAELREMRRREKELLAKQAELNAKIRDSEDRFDEQIQRLRSGNAALQGALEVARRRCDELENEVSSLRRESPSLAVAATEKEEIIALRRSINEIGAAIIKLACGADENVRPASAGEANGTAVLRILANGEAALDMSADHHSTSEGRRSREISNGVGI
jgi:predicted  nucleic acid-binding Zn-ribbon protein